MAPGASCLPMLKESHFDIQNAVWMAVTTPCQDLRMVQHHDLCPLCTVKDFLCNLLPSDDPSTGKHGLQTTEHDLTQGRHQCCVPTPVSRLHEHLYKPAGGLLAHLSSQTVLPFLVQRSLPGGRKEADA